MVRKILLHSFCKIDKIPFFETIFRKSKLDIYKCPFSKISVDFFSRVSRTYYYFLSLKTIKITYPTLSIKGPFLVTIYAVNNSIIILYYDSIIFKEGLGFPGTGFARSMGLYSLSTNTSLEIFLIILSRVLSSPCNV